VRGEDDGLGILGERVSDRGKGSHDAGWVRDGASLLVLRAVEVDPVTQMLAYLSPEFKCLSK